MLLRNLMKMGKLVELQLDELLGDSDLTATKLLTLCQIAQADEPLSLSQLANCLVFVKSNATQLIDNLEKQRMVKRVAHPEDRRCTHLQLTDMGREMEESGRAALQPLLDQFDALYSAEERALLLDLLQRFDHQNSPVATK